MGGGGGRDLAKAVLDRNVASPLRYTHTHTRHCITTLFTEAGAGKNMNVCWDGTDK